MAKIEKPIKKERFDSSYKKEESSCFPLIVSANTAKTAVILLSSLENDILLQTVRSLSKYVVISKENMLAVYSFGALDKLRPLMEHSDIGIRRYTLKLIAQLCQEPAALRELTHDQNDLLLLINIIKKNAGDNCIQEFTSSILALLSKYLGGCDQLLQTNILDFIFERIKSNDPDIRMNFLEILHNILNDPVGEDTVMECPYFDWTPILNLVRDKYLDLQQLSLNVVEQIISRQRDEKIQLSFKLAAGPNELMDVLETYSFSHLHRDVLRVLKCYNESEETIANFYDTGCLTRFIQYMECGSIQEKDDCLAVFLNIAMHKKGRMILHKCNIEEVICHVLDKLDSSLWEKASRAAALMCRHCTASKTMVDFNIIDHTMAILQSESVPWESVKENILLLLAELFKEEKKSCDKFLEAHGEELLKSFIRPDNEHGATLQGVQTCIQCFINIEEYMDARFVLLQAGVVKILLNILEHEDRKVKVLVCMALFRLMAESLGRAYFMEENGVSCILKLLSENSFEVQCATCKVIIVTADELNTNQYIVQGVLHYLIENANLHEACPEWQVAINSLLDQHLPAKFGYCKKLNFTDITMLSFYVLKRPHTRFPEMMEFSQDSLFTKSPVFLIKFSLLASNDTPEDDKLTESSMKTDSKTSLPVEQNILDSYFKRVKLLIEKEDIEFGITEKKRVNILAEFVANQMRGPEPTTVCNNHFVDLHLSELMVALQSYIIPLGQVRAGGKLERAILFKVLADRLVLPARLVRGALGYAWVEVCLPERILSEGQKDSDYLRLSWSLLKPTHVIDLMQDTTCVLPMTSSQACVYCGYPS